MTDKKASLKRKKTPVKKDDTWFEQIMIETESPRRQAVYFSIFINFMALAVPIFTLQVYDRVIFHAGLTTLQGLSVGIFAILGFDFLMRKARGNLFRAASLHADVLVSHKLFTHVMSLPLREMENRPTGFWQTVFNDLAAIRNRMGGPMAVQFIDVPFSFFFLIAIFIIALPIAWIPVLSAILFIFLIWRADVVVGKRLEQEQKQIINRDGLLGELMHHRVTLKSLALGNAAEARWGEAQSSLIEESVTRGRINDYYQTLSHFLTQGTIVSMTIVGSIAIINQNMTLGALIATNMLGGRMIANLGQLLNYWRNFKSYGESKKRLDMVFAIDTEKSDSLLTQEKPEGRIDLSNVSFRYSNDQELVMDNLNLQIGPKGFYVVIGPNGSGKSTLLKIIRGLYSSEKGIVSIDGRDLRQFTNAELAHWIGYMPQDSTLFSGSFYSNITFGYEEATDRDVIQSAHLANCHDIITATSDGYGSAILEGGSNISPGLRQKICLARLYLRNPSIIVLDEPTNHLDQQGVSDLALNLQRMSKNRTVIVITHNVNLLSNADFVVSMEKGAVKSISKPADILRDAKAKSAARQGNTTKPRQAAVTMAVSNPQIRS